MDRHARTTVTLFAAALIWTAVVCYFGVRHDQAELVAQAPKPKDPVVRPRPVTGDRKDALKDVPEEGKLYVFTAPNRGLQTLLVLKVIDGETFEAAYLMPVRVKLEGVTGKDKAATDNLDKLIGGRLVNTSLRGIDDKGNQLADVHFGAPQKDQPANPSGWLSDWLKKK